MSKLHHYLPTSPIFVFVVTTFVIWYATYLWNRRRLYHYGRKVRGPISLPLIGTLYKFIFADGTRVIKILGELVDEYSGIYSIWFGQDLKFVVAIPEYVDKILTSDVALDKSNEYSYIEMGVGKGLFTVSDTSSWRRQRKVMNTFFSRKNLNSYIGRVLKFTTPSVENLKEKLKKGEEVNVVDAVVSNSLQATFDTVFGDRPEFMTEEFNTNLIERALEGLFRRSYVLLYRIEFIFKRSKIGKVVVSIIKQYHNMLDQTFESKKKKALEEETIPIPEKPNLIHTLMSQFKLDSLEAHQEQYIKDEMMTLIAVGSDTSSTTSNFLLLSLGIFPEIQETVYNEVLSVYGKSEPIDWKKIHELKYLDRVMKESFRLFAVAPFVGRKFSDDLDLGDGTILPKGSSTFIPVLHIHRSEKYWSDPLKFDPDRFLPENMEKRHRCTYLPFLHGPRNCVGMVYGQVALKTLVAHFVRELRFTSDYKSIEEVELNVGAILRPKYGFKLHAQLRE